MTTPEDILSQQIIGAAIEVHKVLEEVYEEALLEELLLRGIHTESQIKVPVLYKGKQLRSGLRIDLLVDNLVIVEVKSTEEHKPLFEAQLLTYLRLTNKRLGSVINFGYPLLKDGIHRVVNNLK